MCGVFAGGRNAIVARAAGTDNLSMVDGVGRYPRIRGMAIFTNVAGLNVYRTLSGSVYAVVTTRAITGDIDVIEVCG